MQIEIPATLAAIDNFFSVIIFVIAFISWVVNLIRQNQESAAKQRGPRRPAGQGRNRDVQGEIDEFLTQSRRRQSETTLAEDEIEVVSSPKQRKRPPRRRKSRQEVWEEQTGKRQQQPPPMPRPKQVDRPGEGIASRHLETPRQQQLSYINERVEADLPHNIDQSVATHLKTFSASSPTSSGERAILETIKRPTTRASIAGKLLRSKRSIQSAIILNEILSPPKSRRM